MGILKKAPYDKKMLEVAEIAKALGHPARIKMFQYLRENSIGNNTLFQGITTLSKTAVSQHIQQLQRVGLVISDYAPAGPVYYLSAEADERISELQELIN